MIWEEDLIYVVRILDRLSTSGNTTIEETKRINEIKRRYYMTGKAPPSFKFQKDAPTPPPEEEEQVFCTDCMWFDCFHNEENFCGRHSTRARVMGVEENTPACENFEEDEMADELEEFEEEWVEGEGVPEELLDELDPEEDKSE